MPVCRFPEGFVEIGKDDDHSYNALRTTRLPDGKLKIDVETWGIPEFGLYLAVETNEVLKLQVMGECGTVPSRTPTKVSFSHVVENEEENYAAQIEYYGYAPAELGDIQIKFTLYKRAD